MISSKASRMARKKSPENDGKHNVSLALSDVKYIKKMNFCLEHSINSL